MLMYRKIYLFLYAKLVFCKLVSAVLHQITLERYQKEVPQSPDSLNCRIPSVLTDGGLTSSRCHQYNANVNSLCSFEQCSFIAPKDWSQTLRSATKEVDVLISVRSPPGSVLPVWSQIIKIIPKQTKGFCLLAKFQINSAVGKKPRFRSLPGERGCRSLKMNRAVKHQHNWYNQLQCFWQALHRGHRLNVPGNQHNTLHKHCG